MSLHAQKGVNCLDCHQPTAGQNKRDHNGFVISTKLTAGNCRRCHEDIYQEFLRSRHAAPAWAALYGEKGLTPEQVNFSETYQPGGTRRPPHPFVQLYIAGLICGGRQFTRSTTSLIALLRWHLCFSPILWYLA